MDWDINLLFVHWDRYLIGAVIVALVFCVIYFFRWYNGKKSLSGKKIFLKQTFETALAQKAQFDIKLKQAKSHIGLSATLASISPATLNMEVHGFAGDEWQKKNVEVFLRLIVDDVAVFYVFDSEIRSLTQKGDISYLSLAIPAHLRLEKKRYFTRVTPNPADILMIGVWQAGRRLPRTNADLGAPQIAWKCGSSSENVQVENISGGGLALKFQVKAEETSSFKPELGKQLICLMIFREAPETMPVIFWCTGEIMSVRTVGYAQAVGIEFTNWAVQQQGNSEIHWMHSSPWQGAKPILNWIRKMEKI